ncbi:MAG: biopolymer transporter ExbD [Bacteriovoracaceae bacterium]
MFKPIRKREKHHHGGEEHIDLTALIDIVTLLLFFLLLNSDITSVSFNVAKDVILPHSKSQDPSSEGIMVQISSSAIWVGSVKVADINDKNQNIYDSSKSTILPLYDELVKEREKGANLAKVAGGKNRFSTRINLMVDKSISYRFFKNSASYLC